MYWDFVFINISRLCIYRKYPRIDGLRTNSQLLSDNTFEIILHRKTFVFAIHFVPLRHKVNLYCFYFNIDLQNVTQI